MYDHELSRLMDAVDKLGELHTALYNLGDDAEYAVETVPLEEHQRVVAAYAEEQERLTTIINAHRTEIERLNTLMGGEMLVEDGSTTRTEALRELKSLRTKLSISERKNGDLQVRIKELENITHELRSRLNALGQDLIDRVLSYNKQGELPRTFKAGDPCPPQGVDLLRDPMDEDLTFLVRTNPGTNTDLWVWRRRPSDPVGDGESGMPWSVRASAIYSDVLLEVL